MSGGATLRSNVSRFRAAAPTLVVGVVLAVGWLTVRLLYLEPPQPSDQIHYLRYATQFPGPVDNRGLPHQYLRSGIIAPTAAMVAIFGYSQAAYYAVPLLAGVLLVVGTYALGSLLFSKPVGAAAAVLLVVQSLVFATSSELLPDLFATALVTAAVALAVAVRRGAVRHWRPALVVIGLLLGWSYLVREFIVFVWPLIPMVLYRRTGWRGLLWAAAPAAAVWFAESAVTWVAYGDPLARLHATVGAGQTVSSRPEWAGRSRASFVQALPAVLARPVEGRWLVGLLGVAVAGVLSRNRRVLLLVGWIALWWAALTLLGGLVDPDAPKINLANYRYWFPVFPAIVLGGLGTCWLFVRWSAGRLAPRGAAAVAGAAALAVAAVPVWLAAGQWTDSPSYRANAATQLEQARTWMAAHDRRIETVWSDTRTASLLKIFRRGTFGGLRWDARQRRLTPKARPGPRDVVVLYDAAGGEICGFCARAARDVLGRPPAIPVTWREVYRTDDGVLRIYRGVAGGTPPRTGTIHRERPADTVRTRCFDRVAAGSTSAIQTKAGHGPADHARGERLP